MDGETDTDDDIVIYWSGGNDLASHGVWVWASLGYRIYPYVNWESREGPPFGDHGKHCLGLEQNLLKWRATDCNEKGYYICERRE